MKRALRSVRRLLLVAVIAALAMGMNVFAADVFDLSASSLEVKYGGGVSANTTLTWYLKLDDQYGDEFLDDEDFNNELYISVIPEDDRAAQNSESLNFKAVLWRSNRKKDKGKYVFKAELNLQNQRDMNANYGVGGTYYISGYSMQGVEVTGIAQGTYTDLEADVTGLDYEPMNTTLSQNSISFRGMYNGELKAKRFEDVQVYLPLTVNDSGIKKLEVAWESEGDGEVYRCVPGLYSIHGDNDSGYFFSTSFAYAETYVMKSVKVTDYCNNTKDFVITDAPKFVISKLGEQDGEGYYLEAGYRWKVDDTTQTLFISGQGEYEIGLNNLLGDEENRYPGWCDYTKATKKPIKHAIVSVSSIGSMYKFFYMMNDLVDVDFTGSDLSQTENLSYLFYRCRKLENITWPSAGPVKLDNVEYCFYGCNSITKGVFPNCEFSREVSNMFSDCDSLEEVDLSNCTVEEDSDLDISGVRFDSFMGDCPNLTKFKVPFTVDLVSSEWGRLGSYGIWIETGSGKIHHSCYEAVIGSNKVTTRFDSQYSGTEISEDADRYPRSRFARYEGWAITSAGELILIGDGVPKENPGWLRYADKIRKATVYSENLYSTHQMFSGCTKLESVDFSHVENTDGLTTMAFMFEECIALKSVDLSRFDTSRVWNMQSMFEGCNSLTSIDLSKISTARVFNTSYMFARCIGLKQIDCSGFNLWNLSNGTYMFDECANLTTIKAPYNQQQDIALPLVDGMEWKSGGKTAAKILGYQNASLTYERVKAQPKQSETPAVTEGSEQKDTKTKATYEVTSTKAGEESVVYEASTDAKAKKVTVPDVVTLADGKTYKVTEISDGAFKGNKTVTQITIGKNIETIGANAFSGCNSLTKVSIKGDNVKTVENGAFKGCKKLTTANLGKNVESLGKDAFSGCKNLKSVSLGKKIKSIGKNAFKDCAKMKTLIIKTGNAKKLKVSKGAFKGLNPKCVIKVQKKQLTAIKKILKRAGLSSKIKVKKI